MKNNTSLFLLLAAMLTLSSCYSYTYYKPVIKSNTGTPIQSKNFDLDGYNMQVHFGIEGDKKIFYVELSFKNSNQNSGLKISNLKISTKALARNTRQYKMQRILLYTQGDNEYYPHIDSIGNSLIDITVDAVNSYALDYECILPGAEQPSKRVQVNVEATYEVNGKLKSLKDSVVFEKHKQYSWPR